MPSSLRFSILFLIASVIPGAPQTNSLPELNPSSQNVAAVIGIGRMLEDCARVACSAMTAATANLQQLVVRQQITEAVTAASLDVDDVLAEIANEHARLAELRSVLEARRDRAVAFASAGNLIVGTGIGIAVNALQFKNSTATLGDGIGVGSGVASTILSVVGIRLQNGPKHVTTNSPNMLAVPLGREPVLHSQYPATVLAYLNSVPEGQTQSAGTRLEQLRHEWQKTGRLGPEGSAQADKKLAVLTAGANSGPRMSISDLIDRGYMLEDVAGAVSLMKRDLATLVRSLDGGRR